MGVPSGHPANPKPARTGGDRQEQGRSDPPGIVLRELDQIVSTIEGPSTALDLAVKAVVRGIPRSDAALICLFEADRGDLFVVAAHGYGRDMLSIVADPDRGGAPGSVFRTRRPEMWTSRSDIDRLIHSLEPAQRRLLGRARQGLRPPTSLLCVPCLARGHLVGCIQLERHRDAHPFVLADLARAEAFTSPISLVLNEVLLLHAFQRREAAWSDLLRCLLERQAAACRRLSAELADTIDLVAAIGPGTAAKVGGWPAVRQVGGATAEAAGTVADSPQHESDASVEGLTAREREVTVLVAEGHPNREIAQRLAISVRTVQTHRRHILDKLGAHDRTGIVRFAIRAGLVQP